MLGVKLKGSADRLNVKQERRRHKEDSKALGPQTAGMELAVTERRRPAGGTVVGREGGRES